MQRVLAAPDRARRIRRAAIAATAALVVVAPALACSAQPDRPAASGPAPTTVGPPARPGAPGELIDATPITGASGARAWRITYHSRAANGRDIAVTGTLQVPEHPAADLPLIAWAHPTTGAADACAPSNKGTADLPFPDQVLARGWATVATDYEGLGTADAHPYLVGASEGHAVLDAARAATQVRDAAVSVRSPVIIWGFSQGGHAAAFAGQLAAAYAPDVPVRGVMAAAPVSDVDHFARRAEKIPSQFGVLVTIVAGLRAAHPELDLRQVFRDEVVNDLGEIERECIGEVNTHFDRPIADMLVRSPSETPPFADLLAENRTADAPIPVPVLVLQGALDDIVDPADTKAMVARYCAAGVTVQSIVRPDAKHGVMVPEPILGWTEGRLAGTAPPSTC